MSRVATGLLACLLASNVASADDGAASANVNLQLLAVSAISVDGDSTQLEAQGPGTLFRTIQDAAVDALTYAYLQGCTTRSGDRMRGGTIYRSGNRYRYAEPHVAGPMNPHRIRYALRRQDVARYSTYPRVGRHEVDRDNERPSRADRRSVSVTDPLHRPLYILHPSLVIREYRGDDHELVEVADLRHPTRALLNSAVDRPVPLSVLAYQ